VDNLTMPCYNSIVREKQSISLLKQFKLHSVFITNIGSMLLLSIVLCILFTVFFTNTLIQNSIDQQADTTFNYLAAIRDDIDNSLINLHQSMTQLSYTRNIFNLVITREYNETDVNLAMNDMIFTANNNLLIGDVLYYIPHKNIVISSAYKIYSTDTFPDRDMINTYFNNVVSLRPIENSGKMSFLSFYNGKYILCRDFPLVGSSRLGTLFYLINMNELQRRINASAGKQGKLFVVNADYETIFNTSDYPRQYQTVLANYLESDLAASPYIRLDGNGVFSLPSVLSGWNYIYIVNDSYLQPDLSSILSASVPILILAIVLAAVSSFLITWQLYKPFTRIFNYIYNENLAPDNAAGRKSGNEFDFINNTMTSVFKKSLELRQMVYNVSHDVMTRFFMDLLGGAQFDNNNAQELLSNTKSPFKMNSSYIAFVIHCDGELALIKDKRVLFQSDLRTIMTAFAKQHGNLFHILLIDSRTFAIIMSFDTDISILSIKRAMIELKNSTQALCKKRSINAAFAAGEVYHSILDVGFSYEEAIHTLDSGDIVEDLKNAGDDLQNRAGQIISFIMNADKDEAVKLCSRIIDDIDNSEGLTKLLRSVELSISNLPYIDYSLLPNELFSLAADKNELSVLKSQVCDKINTIVDKLIVMFKKQQNRTIVDAQNYIKANYDDIGLSQLSVSNAIGVTSSYLSHLFNTSLGVRFTDYVSRYRIEKSIRMLKDTDWPVQTIASKCGFYTVQNFIRIFKKTTGVTPGRYRLEQK
jgi:AraC-like DNA-binding protein